MEIYNERVGDLLAIGGNAKKELKVREHKVMGPYVEGLARLAVANFDAIETLMNEGNKVP
jgi:kinesin family protein 13